MPLSHRHLREISSRVSRGSRHRSVRPGHLGRRREPLDYPPSTMTPDDEALISAEIDRAYAFADERRRTGRAPRSQPLDHVHVTCRSRRPLGPDRAALVDRCPRARAISHPHRRASTVRPPDGRVRGFARPATTGRDVRAARRCRTCLPVHAGRSAAASHRQQLLPALFHHPARRWTSSQHDPELGIESDVLIHIGLNDTRGGCSSSLNACRSTSWRPTSRTRIVGFAQKYRRLIISELPEYHYVVRRPVPRRTSTSDPELLAQSRSSRLIATTILPPVRFWSFTPGLQRNFTRYNLILMDAAAPPRSDADRPRSARSGTSSTTASCCPTECTSSDTGHELIAGAGCIAFCPAPFRRPTVARCAMMTA